ncbi:hypothetical protein FSP39_004898 [Pinctada imbricata]|uniref:Mitotic checkpoint serine/threonine-protein kinase BUB1 n=1 Tax=Pinctada imbricata TaxID=66713 RepID=A0AA88XP32_PINIB|nr:hypothetical protein FSP39_004898 [Pinctada imbricata]
MSDWELSKENVQPLKSGRRVTSFSSDQSTLKKEKQEYESALRTYNGDDPLEIWHSYILWIEQAYPKGGKSGHLVELCERCISQFKDDERYQNDQRYIEVWIKYANCTNDPHEIYQFMYDQNIGTKLTLLYEAWATCAEIAGFHKKANAIYQFGVENGAQPYDLLNRRQEEFQKRIIRGTDIRDAEEDQMMDMDENRSALGQLRTVGKKHAVPSVRIGAAKQGFYGGLGIRQSANNQVAPGFQVYNDEISAPSILPAQTGEWGEMPHRKVVNKENELKAGPWTKGKRFPTKPSAVTVPASRPSFSVHDENPDDQEMRTPMKLPDVGKQVLSSRKPDKESDPLYHIRIKDSLDPNQKPMYCKAKIYCGADEFSFEEIRAARFRYKLRKAEEKKRLEEERREIEASREELRRNQEFLRLQAEEIRLQSMALKREQEAMVEKCRQQLLMHQEQFNAERQMQIQRQKEQVDIDIQRRIQQSEARSAASTVNREDESLSSLNSSKRTPADFNNSQSSSRLSAPTPDSLKRSLTAPSPTVNTQEAYKLVMGMFNASLEIDKFDDCGRETTEQGMPQIQHGPEDKSVPFTVFDENSAQKTPDTGPKAPFAIYTEEQGQPKSNMSAKMPFQIFDENSGAHASNYVKEPPVSMHDDERMDGIESQAGEDFTIAPVGSHQSFVSAARCASTPFHPENNSIQSIPDISQIPVDKTRESFYVQNNTDVKNLSPIMEGSNEESDGHATNSTASSMASHDGISKHSVKSIRASHSHIEPIPETDHIPTSAVQPKGAGFTIFTDEGLRIDNINRDDDDVGNQSEHVIDTTTYIPPDIDDKTQALMSTSIYIDPHDPFDAETIQGFLKKLTKPLSSYSNYVAEPMMKIKSQESTTLGGDLYLVMDAVGKGGNAKVYKAEKMDYDIDFTVGLELNENYYALKVQSPPCPWELYICNEIQDRLTQQLHPGEVDVRPSMMSVEKGCFCDDMSCLITKYYSSGTLLDFVNKLSAHNLQMEESIALYLSIELMYMIEKLHKCHIIHGDIKPDNFMFLGLRPDLPECSDVLRLFAQCERPLVLIDFGQSIDMTKYPSDTTFLTKTDLFGLVGTIHVLLFKQYMKVYQQSGTWRITQSFPRKWNQSLWKKLFHECLNVPSCSQLPDLASLRQEFQDYFLTIRTQYYACASKFNSLAG